MSAGSLCSSALPCSLGSQLNRQIVGTSAGRSPNGAFSLTTPASTGYCIITGNGTATSFYCPSGIFNSDIPPADGNGAGGNPLIASLKTTVDASNANLMLKSCSWFSSVNSGGTTTLRFDFNQAPANNTNVFVHWWSPGGTGNAGIGGTNYWTYNLATATSPP